MENYGTFEIQEIPLSSPYFRRKVESFLGANSLRMEEMDTYYTVQRADGEILAGGGLCRDVVKCVAVSEAARSEGLAGPLVSRLIAVGAEHGYDNLKVFTKPENRPVFESLGFHVLARSPQALLMENGRGLETYVRRLEDRRLEGKNGIIVMNADPITLGHRYLIEQACAQVDWLYVIVLGGTGSRFTAQARFGMVEKACRITWSVSVLDGGDYCISPATFPSYFLKRLDEAAEQQMRLDLDLFVRHIAPALGICVRFVGSEPLDPMTARYNELMREVLEPQGIEVREVERLEMDGKPVSASVVRRLLDEGDLSAARRLCPDRSYGYLAGDLAAWALLRELETPCKPGMVCPGSRGAHEDMDEVLMRRGIEALRPYFVRLGAMGAGKDFVWGLDLIRTGGEAEQAMLRATGGVNTHKGALYALGLAAVAAGAVYKEEGKVEAGSLQAEIARLAEKMRPLEPVISRRTHGTEIVRQYGVRGAQAMSLEGYRDLFADWLPYWREVREEAFGAQKLLLRIMSQLDDTCVIHRAGYARARQVKAEAAALLENFSEEGLEEMNGRYSTGRVSPGGSADMLALTVYIDKLITSN